MMAFLATLFTVVNAPFTTAVMVVVFSLLLQLIGLLPWGEHELGDSGGDAHDALPDAAHDALPAAEHAALAAPEHDADLDADAEGDADADHEGDADHFSLLAVLGVGKVPLSIVLQTLLMMFGLVGISTNTVLATLTGHLATTYLLASVPLGAVGGMALSAAVVRTVARLVPAASGQAATRAQLVGQTGVVISSRVSGEFGEVRLLDPAGRTLRLICYAHDGEAPIPEGAEVVVTSWDRERDRLYVTSVNRLLEGKKA